MSIHVNVLPVFTVAVQLYGQLVDLATSVLSLVCGDWTAVDRRGSDPGGLGGGRRRAQRFRVHC